MGNPGATAEDLAQEQNLLFRVRFPPAGSDAADARCVVLELLSLALTGV
jgi:hypothetical protein